MSKINNFLDFFDEFWYLLVFKFFINLGKIFLLLLLFIFFDFLYRISLSIFYVKLIIFININRTCLRKFNVDFISQFADWNWIFIIHKLEFFLFIIVLSINPRLWNKLIMVLQWISRFYIILIKLTDYTKSFSVLS